MHLKQGILGILALVLVQASFIHSLCPYECSCNDEPTSCKIGVSLMTDGCNCCKVCAMQIGERCNNEAAVCDVHRNLFCDFTASRSGSWGVCRARSGKSCFHDDILVTSGSMFLPSCKKRCWCIDGAVGCVPTCPHETHVPRKDRCPNARLQAVPGRCCDQWVCTSSSGKEFSLSMEDFWNDYVDDRDVISNQPTPAVAEIGNGIREGAIYEDDVGENGDELLNEQLYRETNIDDFSKIINSNWRRTNDVPGDINTQLRQGGRSRCKRKTSSWSACSKTCGLGVSVRVTNSNPRCRLMREKRLCEIRPCRNDHRYHPKKGQQCVRHKKARKRVALTYAGCVSTRKLQQRFCGYCRESSRCCLPKETRTANIRFQCVNGRSFIKKMVIIKSCHCPKKCPSLKLENRARFILHSDVRRSREV